MNTRLLAPLSLAAVAVLGFAPSAAHAAQDAACGQPAVPAVYSSIDHPAVVTTVPEVTHVEWLWQRAVPTTEFEYSRTVSPAQGTWSWSRKVDVIERAWFKIVIDQPFVPAIPEVRHQETRVVKPAVTRTEFEYVQKSTGRLRWEEAGWNAEDDRDRDRDRDRDDKDDHDDKDDDRGRGWSRTGKTREVVLVAAVTELVWVIDQAAVPAVPEESHKEVTWVLDGADGPAGATATDTVRVASSLKETIDLADGEEPAGAGWVKGEYTQTAKAVTEEIWSGATAPDGYTATGNQRPGKHRSETTTATSTVAPAGDGWSKVDGSAVTVVDAAAYEIEEAAAWTEMVLVTPEVPATAPCVDEDTDEDTDDTDDTDDIEEVVDPGEEADHVEGISDDAPGEVLGATEDSGDAVLPATGAQVEPWLLALGAGSVLAGTGVLFGGRRRNA
ncbi:MAG: LPXTG cell wall anchor domain-containing protein [Propionibacteriales bacterium]|nr:LPXTG cell wall anchor domain-containing protein [Propionibacteriales bacterium]